MDMKSFEYLYHKVRGMDRERIARETSLSDDEIDMMEQSYAPLLREIAAEMPQAADIGKRFVRLTRYIYANRADQELDMPRPDAVKPREGEMLALPGTSKIAIPSISLHQAIDQHRSLRSYSDQPFSLEELSFLLWASSWARDFRSSERNEFTRRNVPSAGSRHSLECYLLIQRVTGVKPGLYYYHPLKHCLVLIDQSRRSSWQSMMAACARKWCATPPSPSSSARFPTGVPGDMGSGATATCILMPGMWGKTSTWLPKPWVEAPA